MTLDELNRKLDAIAGGADRAILQAVKETTLLTAADARMLAPAPNESRNAIMTGQAKGGKGIAGGLRESISSQVNGSGGECVGTVICNAPYGAYVEFGTGPVGQANHSGISPRVPVNYTTQFYVRTGRRAGQPWGISPETGLPFWVYTPDGGETFVATSGQPASPFMYPAAQQNRETFLGAIRARIQGLLKRSK